MNSADMSEINGLIRRIIPNKRYGKIRFKEKDYFFKFVTKEMVGREQQGSRFISKFYHTPELVYTSTEDGFLLYKYEETISVNEGLLIDLFNSSDFSAIRVAPVLSMYSRVFGQTLRRATGSACDLYFKDRVASRLPFFYDTAFRDTERRFDFNGENFTLSVGSLLHEIEQFFLNNREHWCVASQCDPGDLNIGIKPVLLDCTGGGFNPLAAELAVLFWYQIAQTGYFSPTYHPTAYAEHDQTFSNLDLTELHSDDAVTHHPSYHRINFLELYFASVVLPLEDRVGSINDLYEDFRIFLAMRVLSVFNISTMSQKDLLISLGYLTMLSDSQVDRPRSFLELLERLKTYAQS